jgi:hypothetical protein
VRGNWVPVSFILLLCCQKGTRLSTGKFWRFLAGLGPIHEAPKSGAGRALRGLLACRWTCVGPAGVGVAASGRPLEIALENGGALPRRRYEGTVNAERGERGTGGWIGTGDAFGLANETRRREGRGEGLGNPGWFFLGAGLVGGIPSTSRGGGLESFGIGAGRPRSFFRTTIARPDSS